MTVRTWIVSSLRLLGVLASGETMTADQAAEAMAAASDMLDAWAAERLTIYGQTRTENAIVASQQRYTIGAGGNWTQERPLWIDGAAYLTADGREIEIDIYSRDMWQSTTHKSLTSAIPAGLFYNPTFPLGAIDVWPVPTDASLKIVLYTPQSTLKTVSSLDTVISMPEGWAKALRYNLAVELAPEYPASMAGESFGLIVQQANESLAAIKRPNTLLDELEVDSALLNPAGVWSVESGEFI